MQHTNLKSQFLEPRVYIAAVIGFAFGALAIRIWGWYAVDNTVTNWLLDEYARKGQDSLFQTFAWIHDFVFNFVLAIPIAMLLYLLIGQRSRVPVWAAVVGLHIALFWDAEFRNFDILFGLPSFWVGLIISISAIPLAYLCVTIITRKVRT